MLKKKKKIESWAEKKNCLSGEGGSLMACNVMCNLMRSDRLITWCIWVGDQPLSKNQRIPFTSFSKGGDHDFSQK